jgi:hypothetical protein
MVLWPLWPLYIATWRYIGTPGFADADTPPWYPFRSRANFEQAELFLCHDCADTFIDSQLRLIHAGSPLGHSITLKSSKEMHKILACVPTREDLPGVRDLCYKSLARVLTIVLV